MRKNMGFLAAAFALGLAGSVSAGAMQKYVNSVNTIHETKATATRNGVTKERLVNHIGGLDLVASLHDYGMSPKEYGMRFGHGNSKGKSNRLRLSHNAKLKRR